MCVIGCGAAGFAAAMRSYDFDNHVCIVEGSKVGGASIHNGALSSKIMWEIAKDYSIAKKTNSGYSASSVTIDYEKMRNTVLLSVDDKQYHIRSQIETFAKKDNSIFEELELSIISNILCSP